MIPMVGIGFLPSADSGDVLPSAFDEELIENLEDDDQVTGEIHYSAPFILFLSRDSGYLILRPAAIVCMLPALFTLYSYTSLPNYENPCSSKHSAGGTAVRKPSECRGRPSTSVCCRP